MEALAELRTLIARHAHSDGRTALTDVLLSVFHQQTEPMLHVYQPTFALVAQGAKRAVLGDRVYDYGTGQYLVVTIDLPLVSQVIHASANTPFMGVGMVLKPVAIASLLIETAPHFRAPGELPGLATSNAAADLIDPVVRLLRLLDRPDDILVLQPMIEREILWRLLAGEQGAMLRQIGLADSHLSQISHAIRWIRAHYTETLRIEELASLAAMSVSSFHRHFRAVTAMSPLQYQKQIRLQEARARLLTEGNDIASVGYEVGYDSPSQFSREYSRLFGAPPGRDIARLQTSNIAPLDSSVI